MNHMSQEGKKIKDLVWDPASIEILGKAAESDDELVAEHARWAREQTKESS